MARIHDAQPTGQAFFITKNSNKTYVEASHAVPEYSTDTDIFHLPPTLSATGATTVSVYVPRAQAIPVYARAIPAYAGSAGQGRLLPGTQSPYIPMQAPYLSNLPQTQQVGIHICICIYVCVYVRVCACMYLRVYMCVYIGLYGDETKAAVSSSMSADSVLVNGVLHLVQAYAANAAARPVQMAHPHFALAATLQQDGAQRGRATPTLVGTQIIESPLRRDDLQQNEKMMMRQDAAQRGRPTSHAVGTHTFGWIESPLRRDDAQQREQEKRDRRSALSRALLRVHSPVVPGLVHPHASVI